MQQYSLLFFSALARTVVVLVSLIHTFAPSLSPQFAEAIADFTAVIAEDPLNANAYFNRGATHDSIGAYEKAVADYSRALEIDQNK